MPSLIDQDDQKKILADYLAKLQNPNTPPSIDRGKAAITSLADSSSLGTFPTIQGLEQGWEAAKNSPSISGAPSQAMDAFLKARGQAQNDVSAANQEYPYQSMAINAAGSLPMNTMLPGGTLGKSIASGLMMGAGQSVGHANSPSEATSTLGQNAALMGGLGTIGSLGLIGVKNEGNLADATEAFLANRLKKTNPLAAEEPAGELVDKSRMFGFLKNENMEAAAATDKTNTGINQSKRKYGDISDNAAMMLNNLEARFGDDPIVGKIKDAQGFDNEMPWVSRKDLGGGPMPMPNYDTTPTGKIGKGFPLHYDQDPFQWADSKYGATKELLQKHAENGIVPEINTASDLVARDDYMALMPKDSKINLYVTGLDSDLHRTMFPGHASDQRVLSAAQRLQDNGFTDVNVVPASLTKAKLKEASESTWSKESMPYLDRALENNKSIQNDIGLRNFVNKYLKDNVPGGE